MSGQKGRPKGKSSNARKSSKPSKSRKPSEPSKSSESSESSDFSRPSKAKHERTWTDWGFGGLNIRGSIIRNAGKKAEVEKKIDDQKLDILVIGESCLKGTLKEKQHKQLQIDGFSYVRFDRINQGRAAGGLIIYIRTGIQFSVASFCQCTNTDLQYVELAITHPFRFDLVAIYSPPNNNAKRQVQELMYEFLKRSNDRDIPVMFIGDLNIACKRNSTSDPVPSLEDFYDDNWRTVDELFQRFERYYNARALITAPTCGTDSCIDHIITNIHSVPADRPVPITGSGVTDIRQKISDHNLIWCRVNGKQILNQQQQNNYLLRLHDGRWERTEIDNDGNQVGGFTDLSQNVQLSDKNIRKTIELMEEQNRPEDGKKIACLAVNCNKKFDTYDAMKQHVYDKHFPCFDCDKVFKDKYYGPKHMQKVHGIYMCRRVHCNNLRFSDSQERDEHENDGNHLVCKQCKPENRRAFSNKAAYERHKKSHRQHGAVATK